MSNQNQTDKTKDEDDQTSQHEPLLHDYNKQPEGPDKVDAPQNQVHSDLNTKVTERLKEVYNGTREKQGQAADNETEKTEKKEYGSGIVLGDKSIVYDQGRVKIKIIDNNPDLSKPLPDGVRIDRYGRAIIVERTLKKDNVEKGNDTGNNSTDQDLDKLIVAEKGK